MRSEPKRLRQAPILEVLSDPEAIQTSVRKAYKELGYLLDEDGSSALLADAVCKDCPIVGVTQGFVELTGFSREHLLGKNCRVMLEGVPEVAISKSARKNLRDFCRMCLFVGMSQISEATSLQPNARQDGSQFMNFFMVGLCQVDRHPFILGVQMLVGEGLLARLTNKQMQEVQEEARSTLLRLRRLLCARQPAALPPRLSGAGAEANFAFYGERLQDHCTLFNQNLTVVRREPHELATNCLVYGDTPVKWSEPGLYFVLKVDDIVTTFSGLPLLGFTRRKPADVPDLYPPVSKCMGSSILIGACGEAFARDKHEHFRIGFKAPPSSEIQTWSLQKDVPNHRREPPLTVCSGDELGCLYTRSGRLQFWRNGKKAMDFDLGRPPEVGVDYYAVVDVCFAVYSLTLIDKPPPVEEPPGADAAGGTEAPPPAAASAQPKDLTAADPPQCPPGRCECHLSSSSRSLGLEDSGRQPCSGLGSPRYIGYEAAQRAIRGAVDECRFCVTVASPDGDVPLIAVSEEFEAMTGYCRHEILGKNCRFLNGDCFVSSQDLMGLRMSSVTGAPFTALLPNRKKSGELFVNLLDLQGLAVARNFKTGEVLWYCVGIQADVTGVDDEVIPERHRPERIEVGRQIRRHLRLEIARGFESSSQGAPSHFQLLDEPLWMHGSEWVQDCIALGTKPPNPIRLEATMPPGSKISSEGPVEKSSSMRSIGSPKTARAGEASVRSFSKAYSEKAAQDERSPGGRPSLPPRNENSTSEGTICLLKGWFAFSVPVLGALTILLASILHRRSWH